MLGLLSDCLGQRAPVLALSLLLAMGALVGYSRESCTSTHTHTLIHTHTHTLIYTLTHSYTHTHTLIYTHTHTHTHTHKLLFSNCLYPHALPTISW